MKILVTGATGFVGLSLIERLVSLNKYTIIAIHKNSLNPSILKKFHNSVTWIQADLTKNSIIEHLFNVDTVIHLAANCTLNPSKTDEFNIRELNINSTVRLADNCKSNNVRKFIFISSVAASEYSIDTTITESNGIPLSFYGKSKKIAEDYLIKISDHNFSILILRPTALFGENHLGSVYELVKHINSGSFVLFGDGHGLTNFYYINDFIDTILICLHNKSCDNQVFIASDKSIKLSELAEFICKELGKKNTITHLPLLIGYSLAIFFDIVSLLSRKSLPFSLRRLRAIQSRKVYSSDKIKLILGVTPSYGVLLGIRNTISWYKLNGFL
jgi:nucleoside-diphosphate-sugar epimerase